MYDVIVVYCKLGFMMLLVLVGDVDYFMEYSVCFKKMVVDMLNVIMMGFFKGEELQVIFFQVWLFLMFLYYEGLLIVFFEVMVYLLFVVVSDIFVNFEVKLLLELYFEVGNVDVLV